MCKGRAILVGGGGIFDGRGIAACMALGAERCGLVLDFSPASKRTVIGDGIKPS